MDILLYLVAFLIFAGFPFRTFFILLFATIGALLGGEDK